MAEMDPQNGHLVQSRVLLESTPIQFIRITGILWYTTYPEFTFYCKKLSNNESQIIRPDYNPQYNFPPDKLSEGNRE